jgi:hypothetical protein
MITPPGAEEEKIDTALEENMADVYFMRIILTLASPVTTFIYNQSNDCQQKWWNRSALRCAPKPDSDIRSITRFKSERGFSFFDAYKSIPAEQRTDIAVSRVQCILLCRLVLRYAVNCRNHPVLVPRFALESHNSSLPGRVPGEAEWSVVSAILTEKEIEMFKTYYGRSDSELVFEYACFLQSSFFV